MRFHSLLHHFRVLASQLLDRGYEWRFGIQSGGSHPLAHLMDSACNGYRPTGYRAFRKMMHHVKIRPGQEVFLDLGSGMGRAVLIAATYPFRKVIGVEITAELNAIAQENAERVRSRLQCQNVEFHTADAREFRIAADVTVIYLWNPFFEAVLAPVFENIKASITETPRRVTILYVNPPGTPHLANLKEQLKWLVEVKRVPWGDDELVVYTCGAAQE